VILFGLDLRLPGLLYLVLIRLPWVSLVPIGGADMR
jgi:hypothetical protein